MGPEREPSHAFLHKEARKSSIRHEKSRGQAQSDNEISCLAQVSPTLPYSLPGEVKWKEKKN